MFDTISVIGGDLRQLTLARLLKKEGYSVFLYGFEEHQEAPECIGSLEKAFRENGYFY